MEPFPKIWGSYDSIFLSRQNMVSEYSTLPTLAILNLVGVSNMIYVMVDAIKGAKIDKQ